MSNDEVLAILRLMADYDCYYAIFWHCYGEFAPITFFVNCNDLFYWATADCEQVAPEDVPSLQEAINDVCAIDKREAILGFLLWCARKRKMRPQQPAYPKDVRLRALFDACGPVRARAEEG